jgi:hypothetical protein
MIQSVTIHVVIATDIIWTEASGESVLGTTVEGICEHAVQQK